MTDNVTYNPQSYVYNLSGALIEEVYPSGRVVKNTLDQDGDLAQVQSKKLNGTLQNYANAFTYTSAGAVSSMRLGNGKFENTTFNSRLQPIQIGLGSSATSQNLLKLNFDYGVADNNGNVKSQTITTPTVGTNQGFTATQNYTYDSLNRLKSAVETVVGQVNPNWNQVYKYDRYGNREFETNNNNSTNLLSGCPVNVCNPSANPTNNKLVGTNYDAVGNTKIDANGQTFIYDAENKQVQVNNASGIVGQYYYDGDGKRIKKFVPSTSETTIFVYDAGGKMVAEYSTVTASQSEAKISYLTNDHLGSPRITTDSLGKVVSRRDFMPFGEEIQRANYGSDSVKQKFTGYERDGETGLDYAKARMFGSGVGRFTSPDNFLNDTHTEDPASWNLYVYVRNNPLKFTDPLGEEIWIAFSDTVTETDANGKVTQKQVSGKVQYRNGKLLNADGSEYKGTNAYALAVKNDLNTIRKTDTWTFGEINTLDKSSQIHTIQMTDKKYPVNDTRPVSDDNAYDGKPTGSNIYYDPNNSKSVNGDVRSPIIALAHELSHAFDFDGAQFSTDTNADGIKIGEIRAVDRENRIRFYTGEKARTKYGGIDIPLSELPNTTNLYLKPKSKPAVTLTPPKSKP
jgi:RHS repeat-associated protein